MSTGTVQWGWGGGGARARAFHLWDRGSHCGHMILYVKRVVNALPKVVGFLRVFRFPPTENVDRVGWAPN